MRRLFVQLVVEADALGTKHDGVLDRVLIGNFDLFSDIQKLVGQELGIDSESTFEIYSELYNAVIAPNCPVETLALLRGDRWIIRPSVGSFRADGSVQNPRLDAATFAVIQTNGIQAGRNLWLADGDVIQVGVSAASRVRSLACQDGREVATLGVENGRVIGTGKAEGIIPGGVFCVDDNTFRVLSKPEALLQYSAEGTFGMSVAPVGRRVIPPLAPINLPAPLSPSDSRIQWPITSVLGGVGSGIIFAFVFGRITFLWLAGLGIVIGVISYLQQRYYQKKDKRAAEAKYEEACTATETQASESAKIESTQLETTSPRLATSLSLIETKKPGFWSEVPGTPGFLTVCAGSSDQATSVPYLGSNDDLKIELGKRVRLQDAVAQLDLDKEHIGIFGPDRNEVSLYLSSLLLQITARHSPARCELVFLVPDVGAAELRLLDSWKWLAHVRTGGARGMNEVGMDPNGIIEGLIDRFLALPEAQRRARTEDHRILMIVSETASYSPAQLDRLLNVSGGSVRLIWFGSAQAAAPRNLSSLLLVSQGQVEVVAGHLRWKKATWGFGRDKQRHMAWIKDQTQEEVLRSNGFTNEIRQLARLHDRYHESVDTAIPRYLPLKELVEGLDPGTADSTYALELPLGRVSSRRLDLTLSGPYSHLLIAGTTGSGKSQVLQSLLAASVVRYAPDQLSIIICDFKGEATSGPFAKVPHVIGSASNLDVGEVSRIISFVESEVIRRQQIFRNTLVPDFESYREKGCQLPRLLIVLDEYSEMIDDISSALLRVVEIARLGRSLGIHLIMSTQHPTSDVITPAIAANLGNRIGLRAAGADQSRLVLGNDAASKLPLDLHGRGFLKVANQGLIEFQAPHAGARSSSKPTDTSHIRPLTLRGESSSLALTRVKASPNQRTDLSQILSQVETNYGHVEPSQRALWACAEDTTPPELTFDGKTVTIGWVDDTSNPLAFGLDPMNIDLCSTRPLFVGQSGSGKTAALGCIAYALHEKVTLIQWWSPMPPEYDVEYVDAQDPDCVALALLKLRRSQIQGEKILLILDDIPAILSMMNSEDGTKPSVLSLVRLIQDGHKAGTLFCAASAPREASLLLKFRLLFIETVQLRAKPIDDIYDGKASQLPTHTGLTGQPCRRVVVKPTDAVTLWRQVRNRQQAAGQSGIYDAVSGKALEWEPDQGAPLIIVGSPRTSKTLALRQLVSRHLSNATLISSRRSALRKLNPATHYELTDLNGRRENEILECLKNSCKSGVLIFDLQRAPDTSRIQSAISTLAQQGLIGKMIVECNATQAQAIVTKNSDFGYDSLTIQTTMGSRLSWMPPPPIELITWTGTADRQGLYWSDDSALSVACWEEL